MDFPSTAIITASFLCPGILVMLFATGPKGRCTAPSPLASRLAATLVVSFASWALAFLLFKGLGAIWGFGESAEEAVAALLASNSDRSIAGNEWTRTAVISAVLKLDGKSICFWASAAAAPLFLGLSIAWLLSLLLRAIAFVDVLRDDGKHLPKSKCYERLDWFLRWTHLKHVVRPRGAAYWMISEQAARILGLKWVCAYVLQDCSDRDRATLYFGEVSQIICLPDGRVSSVLLKDAKRHRFPGAAELDNRVDTLGPKGQASDPETDAIPPRATSRDDWKAVSNSHGMMLDGQSILNISYTAMSLPEAGFVQDSKQEQKVAAAEVGPLDDVGGMLITIGETIVRIFKTNESPEPDDHKSA